MDEKRRREKAQAEYKQREERAKEHERRQRPQDNEPGLPQDLYGILDVPPSVTQAELMKAAKKKRIATHPDRFSGRNNSPAEVDAIIERSKQVGHAADILCDPAARVKYEGQVVAWRQKQRAAGRGVPEWMSRFGSSSQAREDQPKYQSAGSRPDPEPRKHHSTWQAREEQPKHQSARFRPDPEPRKASAHRKEDSTKTNYREPWKFYESSDSDDSSSTSANLGRGRKRSTAHSRPTPRPPQETHKKSSGSHAEPRFAEASQPRPSGRSAEYSRPSPFPQRPSGESRFSREPQPFSQPFPSSSQPKPQKPTPSARGAQSWDARWQMAEEARTRLVRDHFDFVDDSKSARAGFANGRNFDVFESTNASSRGSRNVRDEREIREGYRYVRRPESRSRR